MSDVPTINPRKQGVYVVTSRQGTRYLIACTKSTASSILVMADDGSRLHRPERRVLDYCLSHNGSTRDPEIQVGGVMCLAHQGHEPDRRPRHATVVHIRPIDMSLTNGKFLLPPALAAALGFQQCQDCLSIWPEHRC